MDSWKHYAPVAVRWGLAAVVLWFGVNQLARPDYFVGYLPEWLFDSPYATWVVLGNGVFEVIFGILLIAGVCTSPVAGVLALHLLLIAMSLGYNENMIRDLGLTMALLSVALMGEDGWCLSCRWKKSKQ